MVVVEINPALRIWLLLLINDIIIQQIYIKNKSYENKLQKQNKNHLFKKKQKKLI
jgi:hypothetical protein